MPDAALHAKAEAFAALHGGPALLVLPNAWDIASAVLIAAVGFPALATTSAGIAFCRGYRDGERIPKDEMLAEVARMAARVSVPLTADLEAGYGPAPEGVAATVRDAIAIGCVGCNIEDGTIGDGPPLIDFGLAVDRIRAGRAAADAAGLPFVINARTDGFLRGGRDGTTLDETIRRANAYAEAGARSLFVPGVSDAETIGVLARNIDGPLNILAGLNTPPLARLRELGVARVSIGGSLARTAYSALRDALAELQGPGSFGYNAGTYTNAQLNKLLGA